MYPPHYFLEITDMPSALALIRDLEEAALAYEQERWAEYDAEVRLGLSAGNVAELLPTR